ncbi:hypothetical protein QVD17_04383 [Tagetes erecta]|uniref:TF-B3 domain-containing protein n=1 Tax=Tagetes erecta TaxID=13708 RepID=A0AAD8PAD9_TARER|nr:hypothetical protein QVD17_04383 [Tagetes erecta]
MNFMGGESGGSRRQQQQQQQQPGGDGGGNSFEEDEEEERQNTGPPGQSLFPSSSSSSPSSSHQLPPFHPQPPYHHRAAAAGWMEPSSARPDDNNNNEEEQSGGGGSGMMMVVEREHMFDKVVTPSDVGKLNRLVIPKQHAERYFPLDSSTNDKGLLLNFEDRNGKAWRFRYSYWNSSQSYVMTKGWSRFVKDKKLDAGDIVSFQRGVAGSAKDRLFIDWRHRPDAPLLPPPYHSFPLPHHHFSFNRINNIHPWNPLFLQSQPAPSRPPASYRYGNTPAGGYHNLGTGSIVNVNNQGGGSGSSAVIYFRSGGGIPQQHHVDMMQMQHTSGTGTGILYPPSLPPPPAPSPSPSGLVFESVPVVHGKAAAKRLRLFGVNMDCPISDDEDQDYDLASDQLPRTMVGCTTPMENYHLQDQFNHPPTPSSSTIPYQQLSSNYEQEEEEEETQFDHHQTTMMSESSPDDHDHAFDKTTKSSTSRMSLDFDI